MITIAATSSLAKETRSFTTTGAGRVYSNGGN